MWQVEFTHAAVYGFILINLIIIVTFVFDEALTTRMVSHQFINQFFFLSFRLLRLRSATSRNLPRMELSLEFISKGLERQKSRKIILIGKTEYRESVCELRTGITNIGYIIKEAEETLLLQVGVVFAHSPGKIYFLESNEFGI